MSFCPKINGNHVDYMCDLSEGHEGDCKFSWQGFKPIRGQRVYVVRQGNIQTVTVLAINSIGRVTVKYDDGVTDTVEPESVGPVGERWRTGTRNPHTIYCDNQPAGFVLKPEHAAYLVEAANLLTLKKGI